MPIYSPIRPIEISCTPPKNQILTISEVHPGSTVFKKKETSAWDNAYRANPQFYAKDGGSPFGAFALTEGTETILPKTPRYAIEGKEISEYRLMLVSTTKDSILGECDYYEALEKLEAFELDSNDDSILVQGLSLSELEEVLEQA